LKKIAISQVDALFASGIYPIEFLFYYQNGLETLSLREALKKISSSFWPVFGRFESGFITFDEYKEEDFFDEETLHRDFFLPESEEERFEAFSSLRLPVLNTFFFVKVLNFKNGTVLIPKMNHLAGDGYSYFYFLSVLAALSQKKIRAFPSTLSQMFTKPHHRRTALKDFAYEHIELAPQKQEDSFTIEHMEFPKHELSSLLREVSSSGFRISTNDVLSAMVLKKTASLKGTEFGERIRLTIPIDVRRKVKSYGPRFFGNGILLHTAVFERQQIENSNREQIAGQIRQSMPSLSSEAYREYLMSLEHLLSTGKPEDIRPFDPQSGCLVTNLSRMPTDKLNFGTGFPKLVYPLTVEKNSAAVLSKGENFVLRLAY
jgi:NRPS condensation-like uncharacterized protein